VDIITNGGIPYGIYHYSGGGECTWFDFARAIYDQGKKRGLVTHECEVIPCTTAEYPTKAMRPAYSVLDKGKIRATLGIEVPRWEASLEAFLKEGSICVN
jgi:dTDP-4-dehydrorhamnose reductase